MRRQAISVVLLLGLSACLTVGQKPQAWPAARLEPVPGPAASASESTESPLAEATAELPDEGPAPCSDPVEAAYLSDCQTSDGQLEEPSAGSEPEEIEDGPEEQIAPPQPPGPRAPHPFAAVSSAELEQKYKDDPESVGPMSVGTPNAGALVNGIAMPRGDRWELIDPGNAWGTRETIDALTRAIAKVHEKYPDSPHMQIGHISARHGGPLSPHVSHQAGRDVDVSYYLTTPSRYFVRATADNLDRERTWTFVRALISETDVDLILIDRGIQKMLRDYALSIGESQAWLDSIFDGRPGVRPIILHAKGHANHIHIRFYNPVAQETARRLQPTLAKRGKLPTAVSYILHRARSGDTLGSLARRYGTTVEAIQAANGLRTTAIKAKRVYKIPRPGRSPTIPQSPPANAPPRRVPPPRRGSTPRRTRPAHP